MSYQPPPADARPYPPAVAPLPTYSAPQTQYGQPPRPMQEQPALPEHDEDDEDNKPRKSIPELAKEHWKLIIVALLGLGAVIALAIERDPLANAISPHKDAIINTPASWLVPIAILIVLSFPPLFGHEVILLLTGLIWGYWKGFLIAVAGTLIGELLDFLLFKYLLTKRAQEYERKNVFYGALARVMREGNLLLLIMIRYSYIPGHVVTAVQSTTGVSILFYSLACIASLPKQLIFIVLGVQYGISSGTGATDSQVKQEKRISIGVTVAFVVISVITGRIVRKKISSIIPALKAERKLARQQARLQQRQQGMGTMNEAAYPASVPKPMGYGEGYQPQQAPQVYQGGR